MGKKDGLLKRGKRYTFLFKDESGAWKEHYTGTADRCEALRIKSAFLNDAQKGIVPNDMGDWRLSQAIIWWNQRRKAFIERSTANVEPYRLPHLLKFLGDKRLREVTAIDLDNYVVHRRMVPVGPDSINREVNLWSQILSHANLWHKVGRNYKPQKMKASDIGRALTRVELVKLTETALTNSNWEAAFYGSVLAVNSGLRGGEIKKLRIGSIDLEHRCITIKRDATKTNSGARIVELNADAVEAAARLLVRAESLGATKPDHYLMPKNLSRIAHGAHKHERGYDVHQHQTDWSTAWNALTEEASFAGLRFHDLRHTFITHMVERGVPLGVIQTFVGHVSARMLRHYTHVTSGVARAAVQLLDAQPLLTPTLTSEATDAAEVNTVIQ
jgi:integrase